MNKFFSALFFLILFFAIFSCNRSEEKSPPINLDVRGMRAETLSISGKEQLGPTHVLYNLERVYRVNTHNPVFFRAEIERSEGPYIFSVHTSEWAREIEFIAVNKKTVIYFTVSGPCEIKAFSIRVSENSSRYFSGNITMPLLEEVRIIGRDDFAEGFVISHNSVSQSENFKNTISDNKNSFIFDLDGYFDTRLLSHIIIEVNPRPLNQIRWIYVNFYTGTIRNTIRAFPVQGRVTITATDLSEIIPGFRQGVTKADTIVTVNSSDNTNIFNRISLVRNPVDTSPLIGLEADLGTILNYRMERWRQRDFELFTWTIFPEFLFMDLINYRYQELMFKRLAFFVEKAGFAGTLLTHAEMDGLHGWNAHNYKADDLCNFFNLARQTNFKLTEEEELLIVILQKNNIIKKEGDIFVPIKGGILTIAREATPALRRTFLNHEGYHGVFFTMEEFREKSWEIWNNISPNKQRFWEIFLSHREYDITNEYLLVNEVMAFHLQQTPERGRDYFNRQIAALRRDYPEERHFFDNLRANYFEEFFQTSIAYANALFALTGLPPGNLVLIERVR